MRLFRASLALNYIPQTWRKVRAVFIPKPGRTSYTDPKDYRPISLSSFLLKWIEKLLNRLIRDTVLKVNPLHPLQFAYQAGKSTETAHHYLISKIEKAISNKEVALATFLDIAGAFDNTSFDAIMVAANKRGVDSTCVRWIHSMLRTRQISSTLFDTERVVVAERGCPQGGVLSPLLWCLVVDEILDSLNQMGFCAQG